MKTDRTIRLPENVAKLLLAMGRVRTPATRGNQFSSYQGPRECARRVRQMRRQKEGVSE